MLIGIHPNYLWHLFQIRTVYQAFFLVTGARFASSLVAQFEDSVSRLPMREAVRYAKNNMKLTAADMKMYVDSHANGLLENRFQSGDSIAVWLPESAEKVRCDVAVT